MQQSLLRPALLAWVLIGALGCGDPTSPSELIADRFDALAAKLTSDDQSRKAALLVAAHTLRRGAPVNTLNVTVGSETRTFNAVAIQIGFDTDMEFSGTTVIAWRGTNADDLLHLLMFGSTLEFPDVNPESVDDGVYVGSLLYDRLAFMKGTSESWYARSGEGNLEVLSEGATCKPLSPSHTCRAIQVKIDLDVTTQLAADDEPVAQQNLVAPSVTLKGIRYVKKCPPAGENSSSCTVSLISEGMIGGS